jgi:hypothetical protein
MDFDSDLPRAFSPETVAVLEQAFEDVWKVVQAHLEPGSEHDGKEWGNTITRTLVALAANGITDRQQLRSKALGTIGLTPTRPLA